MIGAVVLYGSGGHAKVVAATLGAAGQRVALVLDDDPRRHGSELLGVPIRAPNSALPSDAARLVAIGDNRARRHVAEHWGGPWATAIHPRAVVDPRAMIGEGAVVFAGAVIQADVIVGAHAIVNTGALIDHDCEIGAFAHVAPGVAVAGNVRVGEGALIGVGATIVPAISIGAWATLGAGATAVRDVAPDTVATGVPATPRRAA